MAKFEQYHPIFIGDLKLDWLTKEPLKEIKNILNDSEITNFNSNHHLNDLMTANLINKAMKEIMKEQSLTWAISRHSFHGSIGIFSITKLGTATPEFRFSFNDSVSMEEIQEIFAHMTKFTFLELGKKSVSAFINTNVTKVSNVLQDIGFRSANKSKQALYFNKVSK